jgi:hypothetical protein
MVKTKEKLKINEKKIKLVGKQQFKTKISFFFV